MQIAHSKFSVKRSVNEERCCNGRALLQNGPRNHIIIIVIRGRKHPAKRYSRNRTTSSGQKGIAEKRKTATTDSNDSKAEQDISKKTEGIDELRRDTSFHDDDEKSNCLNLSEKMATVSTTALNRGNKVTYYSERSSSSSSSTTAKPSSSSEIMKTFLTGDEATSPTDEASIASFQTSRWSTFI